MYCVIDIGNTHTTLGVVEASEITAVYTVDAQPDSIPSILNILTEKSIQDVLICSVFPEFCSACEEQLRSQNIKIRYVDHTNIPLENRYNPPSDVGSDRLVAAYGVSMLYDTNSCIIDMGSAITFELVTKEREYLGGLIFPGISLLERSLSEHTALLPRVFSADHFCPGPVGTTTETAIAGGIQLGISVMVPAVVEHLRKEADFTFDVFITGGDVGRFRKYFPEEYTFIPDIVLKGLVLLHENVLNG